MGTKNMIAAKVAKTASSKKIFDMAKELQQFYSETISSGTEIGMRTSQLRRQGPLGKEFTIYRSIFSKVNEPIERDLVGVKELPRDLRRAWMENKTLRTKTKGALRQGIMPHLPGLLAHIGMFVPVPLAQPVGYIIGHLIKYLI